MNFFPSHLAFEALRQEPRYSAPTSSSLFGIAPHRIRFLMTTSSNSLRCGAIPKSELEIGAEYLGSCRNASKAKWDGKKFIYQRYKWGSWYEDTIEHFEDDTQYDVFVPIKKITAEDVKDSQEATER